MKRFDQLKSNLQNIINEFSGKVGIIVKVDREEIFSKNESKIFQSASLIKLFILEALLEKISQGELSYSDKKSVDSMDKVPGFGVLKVLDDNLSVTIKDLATLMITLSDNTATNMLIDILGIDYIQSFIEKKSYYETQLQRKMYDSEARDLTNIEHDAGRIFFKNSFVDLIILAEGENKEAVLLNNRLGECIYENFKNC